MNQLEQLREQCADIAKTESQLLCNDTESILACQSIEQKIRSIPVPEAKQTRAPKEWANYDPTYVLNFIKQNSGFDAETLSNMLNFAIESARIRVLDANIQPIGWMYEDELPDNYPHLRMFEYSIVDGVRLFPIYLPRHAAQLREVEIIRTALLDLRNSLQYASENPGTVSIDKIYMLNSSGNVLEFIDKTLAATEPAEGIAVTDTELDILRKENERLKTVEYCFNEWLEKTKWVQETSQPGELGMHYADVVRNRIEALQAENARLNKESTYALEMASKALDFAKQYQDKVIILSKGTAV